jgi:hypothetical protein
VLLPYQTQSALPHHNATSQWLTNSHMKYKQQESRNSMSQSEDFLTGLLPSNRCIYMTQSAVSEESVMGLHLSPIHLSSSHSQGSIKLTTTSHEEPA